LTRGVELGPFLDFPSSQKKWRAKELMNRAIILQNNQPSNATNQSIALEGGSKVDQNGKGIIC